ncbi:MAG: YdiU family protein [SAR324 cluster bacterium]|nr:YdiU family protein [SAR324 cluster bacterium]
MKRTEWFSDISGTNPVFSALDTLTFDNRFVNELAADPVKENYLRQVEHSFYSRVSATPVENPELVAYSREVASLLNLEEDLIKSSEFTQVFSGNRLVQGMDPYAMCYGGHQFGNWAGQLGDGRAINLGELLNANQERWTIQLKGAGPTPYSRGADGLAVLRSSVREFLCSEAMHHLGVPTTRALSLLTTGEKVMRDMFYNGNPQLEPGAVVCRVAPSFLRFGSFQILSFRREYEELKQLVDFTIKNDFPDLEETSGESLYLKWFKQICEKTAEMIVHWMRVGFVHGVMNTDNMSILGLTIDYGPYGWLEGYDPEWTPNTTDAAGRRYCFGNQPEIAIWNLYQLANSLVPLFGETAPLEEVLKNSSEYYLRKSQAMHARKLGIQEFENSADSELMKELESILVMVETDMTLFYRALALVDSTQVSDRREQELDLFMNSYYQPEQLSTEYKNRFSQWLNQYRKRLGQDGTPNEIRRANMNSVNPVYVLRNFLAQLAIDKSEDGDHTLIEELLDVLRNPYQEQEGKEKYAEKRPEWARNRAGCSMLSCSS